MTDERDSMVAEVEQPGREKAGDDEDERTGRARREEPQPQNQSERQQTDEERRPADLPEAPDPRGQLLPGVVSGGGRAGQLRQLADDDVDGCAGEEPRDDCAGEEPREPAELQDREEEEQPARHERDGGDELSGVRATDAGGEDRSTCDRGERGARPRRDVPRRAEDRVHDRSGCSRVEAVLYGNARDPGVAEILRDDHRCNCETREDVPAKPGAVVARDPVEDRYESAETSGHASSVSGCPPDRHRPTGMTGRAEPCEPSGASGLTAPWANHPI